MTKHCVSCKKQLSKNNKYCSNKCQKNYEYITYINEWKNGSRSGSRGIQTNNISAHIIKYIKIKYSNSCSICGWSTVHEITQTVPLEIDHIDGNHENNTEQNLRLLCPNCHSLTLNHRNLNKGNGRKWRREAYKKILDR